MCYALLLRAYLVFQNYPSVERPILACEDPLENCVLWDLNGIGCCDGNFASAQRLQALVSSIVLVLIALVRRNMLDVLELEVGRTSRVST